RKTLSAYRLYVKESIKDMDQHKDSNQNRDGAHVSLWQIGQEELSQQSAPTHELYDCIIIGAGITGLTAALLLQEAGKRTLVMDAHSIGFGTTGGTTSHVNTFADTHYKEAESAFGEQGAQLFAKAILEGRDFIRQISERLLIDCDFEEKAAFIYA